MATTDYTQTASPFIEAAGKNYLNELTSAIGDFKATDLSGIMGRQFIAGADPLSTQAEALAPGLAGYQPFLNEAAAAQTRAKGLPQLSNQAIQAGAFGGGREGVQRAEYQAASDRNRASLLAQLRGQGFTQAQNLAQQALTNNLNLAQQTPALLSQQIGALGALGTQRQAREQQLLTADQQLASRQALQPLEAAQQFGSGVTSLIAGYPGREVITAGAPAASPLATGLGTASTLAGIYRLINPAKSSPININYGG